MFTLFQFEVKLSVQNFKGHPWRQTKATLVGTQAETCVRKLVEPRITRWNSLCFQKKTFINNLKLLSSLRFHCNWETLHHACGTAFVTNTVSLLQKIPRWVQAAITNITNSCNTFRNSSLICFRRASVSAQLYLKIKSYSDSVFITPTMQILQI